MQFEVFRPFRDQTGQVGHKISSYDTAPRYDDDAFGMLLMFDVCRHRSERRPSSFKANAKFLLFFLCVQHFYDACLSSSSLALFLLFLFMQIWLHHHSNVSLGRTERNAGRKASRKVEWLPLEFFSLLFSSAVEPRRDSVVHETVHEKCRAKHQQFQLSMSVTLKTENERSRVHLRMMQAQSTTVLCLRWQMRDEQKKRSASCRRSEIVGEAYCAKNEL